MAIPSGPGRVINGNPTTFNPNSPAAALGDFVVDFTGAVPGISRISAVGAVRTLVPVAGVVVGPDLVNIVDTAPAAATRRLAVKFTTDLGAPRSFVAVSGAIVVSGAATVSAFVGQGVFAENATAGQFVFSGRADAAGVFTIDIVGTPADTIDGFITDLSSAPVTGILASVVPP